MAQATAVPLPLRHLLTGRARAGAVVARFARSAYLDCSGHIVAMTSATGARGPFTIVVDDPGLFEALEPEQAVHVRAGALRIGPVHVGLQQAESWNPALPRCLLDGADTRAALSRLVAMLRALAPSESVASVFGNDSEIGEASASPAARVKQGLKIMGAWLDGNADAGRAAEAIATDLAGRGVGLTPSGDDVLIGVMHAMTANPRIAGRIGPAAARRLIGDAAVPHTTRISRAYLEAAARGWATEPWHRLVRALGNPGADAPGATRALLDMGETSGADGLTGFCWALHRMTG